MSLMPRRFARIDALRFRSRSAPRHRFRIAGWLLLAGLLGSAVPASRAGAAITNFRAVPTAFSPNGDGVQDSVVLHWNASTAPESLRVLIAPSTGGAPVRTLRVGPRPAGDDSLGWDGTDDVGAPVPDRDYLIRLLEVDATGNPVNPPGSVATVRLDRIAPPAPVFEDGWDGTDTTATVVKIFGTAPQADSVRVFVGGVPVKVVRVAPADSSFEVDVTLAEGVNPVAAEAFDRAGNRGPLSPSVTITYRNTADITVFTARPFLSSPNGDGVHDTVTVQVRLDAATTRLLVDIHPSKPPLTGPVVDTLTTVAKLFDGPLGAGEHIFAWDGRDSTGTLVADGNWYVVARAESSTVGGQPIAASRFSSALFQIDTTAPPVPFPSPPPPASTSHNFYEFTGVQPGATVADSVLVWRGGTVVQRAAGANWRARVTLSLGDNTFTFEATDLAGNRSAMSAPVTIVYAELVGFHAPERFRVGDLFEVNVTRPARQVRIDLYEMGGRRVRTLLTSQVNQRYELPWNLLDDAGITVGDGPYVARLTVSYTDGGTETRSGAIVVAK